MCVCVCVILYCILLYEQYLCGLQSVTAVEKRGKVEARVTLLPRQILKKSVPQLQRQAPTSGAPPQRSVTTSGAVATAATGILGLSVCERVMCACVERGYVLGLF